MSLNKVQFIGHLGKDPEVRYLPNGQAVCNFSVAASERWKDKEGEQQERTEWLRCNAWDKLAEICGEWLKKGSLVYVEGKLQTRQYEKDGVTHYVTEARIDTMRMLGGRPEREGGAAPAPRAAAPAPRPAASKPAQQSRGFDDMDDDIPF
jgi:single-strand DNA-binding protein